MPDKQELIDAYAEALLDHSANTPFVLFHNPKEDGKTLPGRLTEHNGNLYVKTLTRFYLIKETKRVREIFNTDQNVEFTFTPKRKTADLNSIRVKATQIQ